MSPGDVALATPVSRVLSMCLCPWLMCGNVFGNFSCARTRFALFLSFLLVADKQRGNKYAYIYEGKKNVERGCCSASCG